MLGGAIALMLLILIIGVLIRSVEPKTKAKDIILPGSDPNGGGKK